MRSGFAMMVFVLAFTVVTGGGHCLAAEPATAPASRIGVYDSRAVAVAAVGSAYYKDRVQPLEDALRGAKAQGDDARVKELEPKVWARRKQTHRQGFGTAPVHEILDYIKDQIPAIAAEANVGSIVSKWDEAELAKHASAERVDITMRLVEAFRPNDRSLKWAVEVQKREPIPAEELEKQLAKEGADR